MDVPRADGDSVRVWVRATDVMGNTKTDSVLVHVDSSPPVIPDVQLRTTPSAESVHPTYEVNAYDFQSGLKEIHWQIRKSWNHGIVYDGEKMTARVQKQTPSDCFAPRCYCIPKNNECYLRNFGIKSDMDKLTRLHNQKTITYDLVVTVVNNAMLSATTVHEYNVSTDAQQNDNLGNCLNLLFGHIVSNK
ncbi:hypothetical protein NP493_3886g00000 [Ridgeia piscesae]|uniref:Uncharacterized protein n=1 Tax=Ridgeia piscesae TaxID=27915 RepID=A0AAD9J3Y5_RIDPI|nr:hypothetical protein NP493_3886g00000 [Ridgeia piscesae]